MDERTVGTPLSMHDPRVLGPWSLRSRLGAGGMGVVFYATGPQGEAALKMIRPGLLDAPATRDRFRREVAILRAVHDEHICRFLDADLTSEPAWLAMEYLAGDSLRDHVTARGPLAGRAWWSLAAGLAQALDVLASRRITHRDLKPGNVILTDRGPVLIDFGIARPEDATQLTGTGLVTGSPAWLSPEQANLDPTGPPTDVFSFGSLLAYAATGRSPFGEGASVAVLMSILKRPPDLAGVDPERVALLQWMLDKEPTRRPTARQVRDLARAAVAGEDMTMLLGVDPHATVGTAPPPAPPPRPLPAVRTGTATSEDLRPTPSPWAQSVEAQTVSGAAPAPSAPAPAAPAGSRPRVTRRGRLVTALLALAAVLVVGWLLFGRGEGDGILDGGGIGDGIGDGITTSAPPAPASDQLVSGVWLLESYRLNNVGGALEVAATIRNRGDVTASADLRVWIYAGEESLGSVEAKVTDVAAKSTVSVTMTGDATWASGHKTVLLEAEDR